MSSRLQILIPPELNARLAKAAQRSRMSKGKWVRTALERALESPTSGNYPANALARLASLDAPTADIDQMLAEIEAGRR
jgi:predicted transcriptional regulator